MLTSKPTQPRVPQAERLSMTPRDQTITFEVPATIGTRKTEHVMSMRAKNIQRARNIQLVVTWLSLASVEEQRQTLMVILCPLVKNVKGI